MTKYKISKIKLLKYAKQLLAIQNKVILLTKKQAEFSKYFHLSQFTEK